MLDRGLISILSHLPSDLASSLYPALSILQAGNDDGRSAKHEITQALIQADFKTTNTAIQTTVNTVNTLTSDRRQSSSAGSLISVLRLNYSPHELRLRAVTIF